jgi:hypothetical protein
VTRARTAIVGLGLVLAVLAFPVVASADMALPPGMGVGGNDGELSWLLVAMALIAVGPALWAWRELRRMAAAPDGGDSALSPESGRHER